MILSKCCNSPVVVRNRGEAADRGRIVTWYECTQCGKACATIMDHGSIVPSQKPEDDGE